MDVRPRSPTLSPDHLKRVLDAARAARPLPVTPLKSFSLLEDRLTDPAAVGGPVADDYALVEWLYGEIVEGLREQRRYHRLSSPDAAAPLDRALGEVREDFRRNSVELEAWSILFFRWARADLDLSWEQLEQATSQNERTLQRRQERGLYRLTERIIGREQEARRAAHRDRLRRAVPPLPGYDLAGRSGILERAWRILAANRESRRHVALVGPGGIGKTALALGLAQRLIDAADLDGVLWLTSLPEVSAQELAVRCMEGLGFLAGTQDGLRTCCQMRDTLIILDEAEALVGVEANLDAFLDQAAEARLIVTSRIAPAGRKIPIVELPELVERDADAVVARIWPGSRPLDAARRQMIREQAGGNPLALEVATKLAALSSRPALESIWPQGAFPDQLALLHDLYERLWQDLDENCRRLWLAAWLLPLDLILHDLAAAGSGLSLRLAAQAAQQLRQLSLLDLDPAAERYHMHSVARAFLQQKIAGDKHLSAWTLECSARLEKALSSSPHAAALAYRLIQVADPIRLPPTRRIEIIRAAWREIAHQGLWAVWRPLLERQLALADGLPAGRQAVLRRWLGIACRWLGHTGNARRHLEEAVRLDREAGATTEQAQALIELAAVCRYDLDDAAAQSSTEQALTLFHRLHDSAGEERCRIELAQLALDRGRPDLALEHLDGLLRSARASALACNTHILLNNLRRALDFAEEALALSANDRPNLARAQATAGRVYLAMGRLDEAEDHLSVALALLDQGQDMLGWARTAGALARVCQLDHRLDEAHSLLDEAAAQQRSLNDRPGLFITLQTVLSIDATLTEKALADGNHERAAELAKKLRKIEAEWRSLADSLPSSLRAGDPTVDLPPIGG